MIHIADAAEITRLEDALLRFCPSRQWQIVTVTFPATANADLDIPHTLTPSNPELVNVQVLQASQPCLVWQDRSATRVAWSAGLIRVRCTAASAQVTLLLTAAAAGAQTLVGVNNNPNTLTLPGWSAGLDSATVGAVGDQNAADGFLGPGVRMTSGDEDWHLGVSGGGPDASVRLTDSRNNLTPFMVRQFGGEYFVQPGHVSRAAGMVAYLGNPNDAASSGWWDGIYAQAYHQDTSGVAMGVWTTPTFSAGNFTASSGNWTVDSGDVTTYEYMRVGKTLTLIFSIVTTDVSATPTELRIAIPGSYVAAKDARNPIQVINAGTGAVGLARVAAAGTYVECYRNAANTADTWASTSSDNTSVLGQITFEIQ